MGSRREEERNEKIIRGLMKLPPNRRCINCNSLGPQYVCTNFWTFVCMTCSGIHREFTHRVKSVSMAKFTSQEVEALQNGGNQRARETYLKDWDPQRQRLPDSSNVDKVRQFIKNVYVDRKYAGGKSSEKPPRDLQRLASQPDDTRRASSYHSYSQSPPYDYQYEERRYGKVASLTRKPGSDRGHYIWKSSSFVSSPGRMSEQMFEDRFANESTSSRVSDYSVSSGSDLFRHGRESPNFQKDIGYNSPPIQPSRDTSSPNANFSRDVDVIPRPQRTMSSASIGSVDSNSMSLKSYNSGGFLDVVSEPNHAAVPRLDKTSSFPQSSVPLSYGGLDLFHQQVAQESVSAAAPPIDLFNLPAAMPPEGPSTTVYQPPQTSASLDLFETAGQSSIATLDGKPSELSTPKNEGWATFDTPAPAVSISGNGNGNVNSTMINEKESSIKFDQPPSYNTNTQWQPFPNSVAQVPAPSFDSWFGGLNNVQAPSIATSTQSWKAFDDSIGDLHSVGVNQSSKPQLADDKPLSTGDQSVSPIVAEASNNDGAESTTSHYEPPAPPIASHADIGQSCNPSVLPPTGETHVHVSDRKSINPFDFPCDSDLELSDMFLDMNSLQAALPDTEPPSTFLGGVSQQWFPPNPIGPLIPAAAQGGLAYMSGQAPSPQLPNVPTQEPVASIGGNPFA